MRIVLKAIIILPYYGQVGNCLYMLESSILCETDSFEELI